MFSTVHAATGAALGSGIPNAPLAFGLGIISHFLLDRIPHSDPDFPKGKTRRELLVHPVVHRFFIVAIVDLALSAALVWWLLKGLSTSSGPSIISGAVGGILPDLLYALSFMIDRPWLRRFNRFHEHIHFDEKKYPVKLVAGMTTQVVVLLIAIKIIFR